jgi:hypothetical protein
MAISRMQLPRELYESGGITSLQDPRQGYFLGKLVKKITKPIKKIVKSPIGKAALAGAALYGLGGGTFMGRGLPFLKSGGGFSLANLGSNLGIGSIGQGGKFAFDGPLAGLFSTDGKFSLGKTALTGLGAAGIIAPFLMGDGEDEEEEVVEQLDPNAIRQRAIDFYAQNQSPSQSGLYFMPGREFINRNFYAADGGLASMRPGYRFGGGILQKAGQMMRAGAGKVKSLFDDADINISIRDEDVLTDGGLQAQAVGLDVTITPKSGKAAKVIDGLIEEGYDISKAEDGTYAISSLDEGALDLIAQRLKLGGKDIDEFVKNYDDMYSGSDEKMIMDALRNRKAEGGIMDLGGQEKDFRNTGGFVDLGREERADDVPARLSKNEFVFTADAVRNAGGGDIDKGAEVMQNMMDNLEAGGMISEESQGMNPAQEMFEQTQMLESRIA